jgi:hypothetical protein
MESILKNWNIVRVIRLLLGLSVCWQSVVMHEWILGFAGIFVAGNALFNVGCCGINGCQIAAKPNPGLTKEISYEEVDS